jgi:hypothetical protein
VGHRGLPQVGLKNSAAGKPDLRKSTIKIL